jgi:hypothetical protein
MLAVRADEDPGVTAWIALAKDISDLLQKHGKKNRFYVQIEPARFVSGPEPDVVE